MIDFVFDNLLWWHWVVFGVVLVVAEIVVPLFVIIWFGLAAILVGLIDLMFDTTFVVEIALWTLLSVLWLIVWMKFFKGKSVTDSGQSDFRLKTKGVVIEHIPAGERGKVRFEVPVLGSSEWHATADETLEVSQHIRIVDINGQLIKVEKDR